MDNDELNRELAAINSTAGGPPSTKGLKTGMTIYRISVDPNNKSEVSGRNAQLCDTVTADLRREVPDDQLWIDVSPYVREITVGLFSNTHDIHRIIDIDDPKWHQLLGKIEIVTTI